MLPPPSHSINTSADESSIFQANHEVREASTPNNYLGNVGPEGYENSLDEVDLLQSLGDGSWADNDLGDWNLCEDVDLNPLDCDVGDNADAATSLLKPPPQNLQSQKNHVRGRNMRRGMQSSRNQKLENSQRLQPRR